MKPLKMAFYSRNKSPKSLALTDSRQICSTVLSCNCNIVLLVFIILTITHGERRAPCLAVAYRPLA